MINPDTQQVFSISDHFSTLAASISEYIDFNKGNLSVGERNALYNNVIDLTNLAADINMLGVSLVFEDVQEMLNQLEIITDGVKRAVKKALAVQDAINIAAGLITLGTAIVSKNPKAIVKSTIDLAKSLGKKG